MVSDISTASPELCSPHRESRFDTAHVHRGCCCCRYAHLHGRDPAPTRSERVRFRRSNHTSKETASQSMPTVPSATTDVRRWCAVFTPHQINLSPSLSKPRVAREYMPLTPCGTACVDAEKEPCIITDGNSTGWKTLACFLGGGMVMAICD